MARFDQLEHKLESLIDKVRDGNEAKDLLLSLPNQFQPLIVRFERLEEKIKKLTDQREYGKTTLDRAYLIVCKAKMKEKWRPTQFRKIRLFFESKGIKHVNDVTMTHADEYANWITSMYDKPNTRRGFTNQKS